MFFVDGHCDTLSKALDMSEDLFKNDLQFSIEKSNSIGGGIQITACFIDPKFLNKPNGGFIRCNNILEKLKEYEKTYNNNILLKNGIEISEFVDSNSNDTKFILSIENGSAISGNLENINYLYDCGVRIMSVTWNDDNDLGCGAKTKNDTGLTKLGIEYVKKLEKLGIIIDVSHASERTFWDVLRYTKSPIVATHSNVYNLSNCERNLKDEQIKAIAQRNGIIGICYYSDFLNMNEKAGLQDIINHIKYIKNLVGIDYIGLGSDFDGMNVEETANGIKNISEIHNIEENLLMEGFSKDEISRIMSKNWIRVLKKI